jgi:hypothetical protein
MYLDRSPEAGQWTRIRVHYDPSTFTEGSAFIKKPELIGTLSLLFRYGENSGTLCVRSHISVHRATTKYFSNSFVFKNEIEKGRTSER